MESKIELLLAGPGAGKTTEMVERVIHDLEKLNIQREMVIVTYTNAATNDIINKLSKLIHIPSNVFIGTIHSFLVRYWLKPFCMSLEKVSKEFTIVDSIDYNIRWFDDWANKKGLKGKDRNKAKRKCEMKARKEAFDKVFEKGLVTYDMIVREAYNLSKKKTFCKIVANKIQFLYVDEYQDTSTWQHLIFENLFNIGRTNFYAVGDPNQSIYRFRYSNSQINEPVPKKFEDSPIMLLESNSIISKSMSKVNHRSPKEIVDLLNRMNTVLVQESNLQKENCIIFIDKKNMKDIFEAAAKYLKADSKMLILSKENDLIDKFCENNNLSKNFYMRNKNIFERMESLIIGLSGLNKKEFMNINEISKYEMRKLAVSVINIEHFMEYKEVYEVFSLIQQKFKSLFSRDMRYSYDTKDIINFDLKQFSSSRDSTNNIKCTTIHKAKGLEADVVLVIAKTENQLKKWLSASKTDMENVKDDDYRLGYVAFSRAKEKLLLSCLKSFDKSFFSDTKCNIEIV